MSDNETTINKQTKREYWLEHIKQWELGKLPQESYCNQVGISYNTFIYWRGKFFKKSIPSQPKKFVPIKIEQSPPEISPSIKIKLATGNIICIPISIGIPEIARLIRLMEMPNA